MTVAEALDSLHLLKPSEVAALFRVRVPSITRWADTGKLTCVRTLGGHRRPTAGPRWPTWLTGESIA
ncbi:helix-turn-helix domain-containing protein [Nonomuraea sp. NPDC049784]|uniref:helix-turn-helix domain-containing protein n=1 Tax=Nonomuraea sp. NPDC049784 TaxID=3154361 RepID=UPI0033DF5F77